MYVAKGAIGSTPIASSAIAASGIVYTPLPVPGPFHYVRRGPIGSSPIGSIPIAVWLYNDLASAKARACFRWAGTVSLVGYWTEPTTSVTFATPKTAYVLSVGPKKFKQVQ